ncbi:hypothetical protein [Gelidibacter gilvus]|uniref:Uncharacterized protein n=1 Tax=Gelidibacter gilvus TaxID=59602 RepID=A0A4Q0XDP8_9FLAO|nr:hypothetical protein [Gelidibacter gilvus]RXJ45985.1 hypothetical protein ESZ48_14340 [Gelidibacter gilvus]
MNNTTKEFVLKYGIPTLAVIVIAVHLFLVNTKNLSKWKGGGYGMYTELHYFGNQIYIPGMSLDSLLKDNQEMKKTLSCLMVMPNIDNLNKAGQLILKTTQKDSIHVQIWKPIVNSKNGHYSRVLIDEVYLKTTGF